jgi:hypothetical protein
MEKNIEMKEGMGQRLLTTNEKVQKVMGKNDRDFP